MRGPLCSYRWGLLCSWRAGAREVFGGHHPQGHRHWCFVFLETFCTEPLVCALHRGGRGLPPRAIWVACLFSGREFLSRARHVGGHMLLWMPACWVAGMCGWRTGVHACWVACMVGCRTGVHACWVACMCGCRTGVHAGVRCLSVLRHAVTCGSTTIGGVPRGEV